MASDGDSVSQYNGGGVARSNGSTDVVSQSAVLPSGVTNGTHKTASLADNGSANGDKAPASSIQPPSYFGHDREEVTRILIQALSDMGYQAAAESVSEESGFKLENPTVAAFRSAVLDGSWAEAEELLTGATTAGQGGEDGNGLVLAPGSDRNVMRFGMRQQKFLELLETRDTTRALQVLRTELTPLEHDTSKVHFLSSLLMCLSADDLMAKANWDGARGQSRKRLLSDLSRCISPSVMLPENRLAVLLHQVKQSQINSCLFHTAASSPSLYSDHLCDRRFFPRDIVLELPEMRGEVWEVQFSHDGSHLAACGSGDSVFIWETRSFTVVHALSIQVHKDHHSGVASIAWSPDDSMLSGLLIKKLKRFDEPVSGCVWASDSATFVLGTLDNKRSICTFNNEGEEVVQWNKKHRVQALAGSRDGRWLVAADNFTNMYVYNGATRELEYELDLGARPISLSISLDSRQLLVNKEDSEAQLVDLITRTTVQKFLGHMTDNCVIRASFGGANESFAMSGSEDGKVVIWHKNIGAAVERLSSFSGKRCNCVVWNPVDPYMLASCNDDGKVRIWANRKRGLEIRSRIPGLTGWKHYQNESAPYA
ncbi:WD repeat protein [Metarhizium album ARSEF 1941]|uniref:WD repeat protein n=1 Tax=Metarhizium album (strain ARSEF 1941) TaxID=1081103 RepID=A0A0B2WQ56_METAS|nr:WD repeat protein [Metarhizium album ARSEF 1941]KHN95734.1 WD repeat protein [Metarhizium album ARSEF 1941]